MKRARNRRYGKWQCVALTAPLPSGRMQDGWYVADFMLDPDAIPDITIEMERQLIRPRKSG